MATYTFQCPHIIEGSFLAGNDVPQVLKAVPWFATISLIKRNGVFEEQRWPTGDELIPLEDGVDYFMGGYVYRGVPQEVADILIASGYEDGLAEE
jgi:hypothetical protein